MSFEPTKKIPLNHRVSRHHTYRAALSRLSWQRGIENFFLEEVPFSFSASPLLIKKIKELLQLLIGFKNNQDPLHLYDIGSGTGLLIKNLISACNSESPELLEQIKCHITDASFEMIRQIQDVTMNDTPGHRYANYQLLDIENPIFSNAAPPSLISLFYVLDALSVKHIKIENNKVYELKITEQIDLNAKIIDTTEIYPQIITASDIKKALQNHHDQFIKKHLSKLSRLITENYEAVPMTQTDLTAQPWLQAYADAIPNHTTHVFNYPEKLPQILWDIYDQMTPESILLIYDIGISDPYSLPALPIMRYGAVECYPLDFNFIKFLLDQKKITYYLTKKNPGENHIVLVYKGKNQNTVQNYFENHLIQLTNITDCNVNYLASWPKPALTSSKKILEKIKTETPDYKDHFGLLVNLAVFFYEKNLLTKAAYFIALSLRRLHPIAIQSLMVLGKIYMKKNDDSSAERCFKKILTICPQYADAYNELVVLYLNKDQPDKASQAIKQYLIYCQTECVWDHILTLIVLLIKESKTDDSKKLVNATLYIQHNYPTIIPHNISEKLKKILNEIIKNNKTA